MYNDLRSCTDIVVFERLLTWTANAASIGLAGGLSFSVRDDRTPVVVESFAACLCIEYELEIWLAFIDLPPCAAPLFSIFTSSCLTNS